VDGSVKVNLGEAHLAKKTKKILAEKHTMRSSRPNARKTIQSKKPIPDLPPKKMRYFSAPPYPRNRPARRKKPGHRGNSKDIPSDSDSIHNSDVSPMENQSNNNAEFLLEVVLPCAPPATERDQQHTENQAGSGTMCLLNSGNIAAEVTRHRSGVIVLETPSRQVMEATKILSIQEEVGIRVQSSKEEHLKRIETMEERDRAEKEG
jgi:hypothetical protein